MIQVIISYLLCKGNMRLFCLTFFTSMKCHIEPGLTKNMDNDILKWTCNFLYGGKENISRNMVLIAFSKLAKAEETVLLLKDEICHKNLLHGYN